MTCRKIKTSVTVLKPLGCVGVYGRKSKGGELQRTRPPARGARARSQCHLQEESSHCTDQTRSWKSREGGDIGGVQSYLSHKDHVMGGAIGGCLLFLGCSRSRSKRIIADVSEAFHWNPFHGAAPPTLCTSALPSPICSWSGCCASRVAGPLHRQCLQTLSDCQFLWFLSRCGGICRAV